MTGHQPLATVITLYIHKKKKKQSIGVLDKKQKKKKVRGENERENPQGIGVLDISFKDFQGVLERLAHGSYVHLTDHTR